MQIGLFFGSFNPIHLGHTRLAQHLLNHTPLEEIWLVVSPNNPLKPAGSLLDEEVRFRLAQMATQDTPGIIPCRREFTLPKPNYTITTLTTLAQEYPQHRFSLIIGSDNLAIFHQWRQFQTILDDFTIYVYPRIGDDMHALTERYPMVHIVEAPVLPISATMIRQNIRGGIFDDLWLHPDVKDFLQKNRQLFANIN